MGVHDLRWRRSGCSRSPSLLVASSLVILALISNLPSAKSEDVAPQFLTRPSNQTIRSGMNVDFKCKASGFPTPVIKWYKKKRRISPLMLRHFIGKTFKTLYIIPVYWSDAGQITCEASNSAGTIRAHAYLRVVSRTPPSWTKEPQNVTLYVGQRYTIPCSANAYPEPIYTWTRRGISADLDPAIMSRFDGGLIVLSAHYSHRGPYTCTVRNIAGSISKTIYVNVLEDPTIIRDPKDAVGVVGQDLSLQCVVIGNPAITVSWEKDDMVLDIPADPRMDVRVQDWEITAKLYTLNLRQTTNGDAGRYKCVAADDKIPKISNEAVVTFTGFSSPPTVNVPDPTRTVAKGSDAILKCIFTGTPLPQITWFIDILGIQVELTKTMSFVSKDSVESSLLLGSVSSTDEGVYYCKGTNKAGVAVGNVTLILPADPSKPKLVTSPATFTGIRDHNVSLSCMFTGIPQPEVEWFKDGEEIADELGQIVPGHNNTYIAWLGLSNLQYKDAGKYLCRGLNPHGQADGNVTLVIKGRPMPPNSLNVEVRSRRLILVTWKPGKPGGVPVSYTIEYKHEKNQSWTEVEAGRNTSKTLRHDGGWNGTLLRVHASNSYGSSKPTKAFVVKGKQAKENITVSKIPSNHEKSRSMGEKSMVIGLSVGAVFLLAVLLLLLLVIWRRRKSKKDQRNHARPTPSVLYTRSNQEEEQLLESSGLAYSYVPVNGAEALDRKPSAEENQYQTVGAPATWEVPKRCLTMDKDLGAGHFGKVVKAFMKTENGTKTVAVKMLKENADSLHKKEFLAELDLMKSMKPHPNIVCLIGSCTKGDDPFIIVEYCALGSLQDLLRKSQGNRVYSNLAGGSVSLTSRDLLSFMWQVARGMSYLASLKLVHRDLATRNVLVDTGNICKIADFGLARDIYEDNQYLKTTEGELPLRWMAIESIFHGITTTESDVWSFGVLMWEIITLGAKPYPGFNREQLISNLHLGYRMPRPPYCKEELYAVIWQCWQKEPSERPNFSMLCRTLNRMLAAEKVLIDLDNLDAKYINANSSGEPILMPEKNPNC